jgi:hypothetical protein
MCTGEKTSDREEMQEMEAHEAQQDAKDEDDKELDGAEPAEAVEAAVPLGRLWQTYGHLTQKVSIIKKGHQLPPAFRSSFRIHGTKRTCQRGFFDLTDLGRFGSFNVMMPILKARLKILKSGCWRQIATASNSKWFTPM